MDRSDKFPFELQYVRFGPGEISRLDTLLLSLHFFSHLSTLSHLPVTVLPKYPLISSLTTAH